MKSAAKAAAGAAKAAAGAARVGAQLGAKATVAAAKGGAKLAAAGAKAAAAGGKAASKASGGPVGAVMILFDIVSLTLDLLDVDGFNTYTSQDMIEKGKRAIDHGEYASIGNVPELDYPRLFPLDEFCPDEFRTGVGTHVYANV